MTFAVTGSLSELQISYVCREVLQVRRGQGTPKEGRAFARQKVLTVATPHISPGTGLLAFREEDTSRHQGRLGIRVPPREDHGWGEG